MCSWQGHAEDLANHFCIPGVKFQPSPFGPVPINVVQNQEPKATNFTTEAILWWGPGGKVCTSNAVACKNCGHLWEPDFNESCPWCEIRESAECEMWTSSTMVDGKSVECADPECPPECKKECIPVPNPKATDSAHKIPLDLCPGSAIVAIASVIAQGHKKPGREIYNWREKPISYRQYHAAVLRHLAKYLDGEEHDTELSELTKCDESGNTIEGAEGYKISHLDAAISSLAILIDARECGTLLDDRPGKGGAAKYLNRITKDPKK